MANNHTQFTAFNSTITLKSYHKETLKGNRKAIRERITKYFKDNYPDDIQPKYHSQGSFAMNTILNPINDSDSIDSLVAFDLDDGVYLISDKNNNDDRLSVTTYHRRVYNAVEKHTSLGATDKTTCVRVEYAAGHHIDLPIYFKRKDFKPTLAHKSKDWIDSDPMEFYEWFNAKAKQNQQLRRVVRYLKAWSDNCNSQNSSVKMPSGFILTILAVNNFIANERDDVAMKDVLMNMNKSLKANFSCTRPTTPIGEELFGDKYSNTKKNNFLSKLDSFATSAEQAINETNPKKACLKWQKHFGDRFCCSTAKDEDEDVVKQSSAPIITKDSRYA